MQRIKILPLCLVLSCVPNQTATSWRVGECSAGETTGEPEPPPAPMGIPTSTGICPEFHDGVVQICPAALDSCRSVLVANTADTDGTGPLAIYLHGTYESPQGSITYNPATDLLSMVQQTNGLLVLPSGDPQAAQRFNNPFPWWVVCGPANPSQCTRPDDFLVIDELVACAVEAELVSPDRLTIGGLSAGGIMTSHVIDRVGYFAGAVSWSGGLPPEYQPLTPMGLTDVMTLHGGETDQFCGAGQLAGTCYSFVQPSVAMAAEVSAAGNFSLLCNHTYGHGGAMGIQGAQFAAASLSTGHQWENLTIGQTGNWMIDHFCTEG